MEYKSGQINCFFIDKELQWEPNKKNCDAIYINATEEEFNELLEEYISEIEANGRDFNINFFRNYTFEQGYYSFTEPNAVIPPYAPYKRI